MKNLSLLVAAFLFLFLQSCKDKSKEQQGEAKSDTAAAAASITFPKGFAAVVVADSLTSARHIAVNSNGDLYVRLEEPKNGKGIVRLRDTNNDGVADDVMAFGSFGGTGIAISNGYLYASSDDNIYRYKMENNEASAASKEEMIVQGLLNKREHSAKAIAVDGKGFVYVNIGAPSNACQEKNREKGSMGMNPCPILDSAGGIWRFSVDKLNQKYADGVRYATGIRNIVGLDWNAAANDLYAVQHGRDDLDRMFPELYTEEQRTELPAEEMFRVKQGSDFGWPYCYYDPFQKKKVQGPEYGGDGKKTTGCEKKQDPIYAFPAHWAPNALLFYTGTQFPEKYRNGAFIAFHGSWNRAPREQAGFNVVFLPFKNGMPSGEYEVFADGFAGPTKTPDGAVHRPCGLAQGPDGSLYISDDKGGTIWKVTYKGAGQ
jgi:glucose/arabinose dehydrogenase